MRPFIVCANPFIPNALGGQIKAPEIAAARDIRRPLSLPPLCLTFAEMGAVITLLSVRAHSVVEPPFCRCGCGSRLEILNRRSHYDFIDIYVGWLFDRVSNRTSNGVSRNAPGLVEVTDHLRRCFVGSAFLQL